jgi:hypothetical protein
MTFSKTPLVVMRPKAPTNGDRIGFFGVRGPGDLPDAFDGVRALIDQGHHPFKIGAVGFALNIVDQVFKNGLSFK